MKQDDIKKAFHDIQPSDSQKQRMLNNILYHSDKNRKVDFMKLLKPKMIAAALAFIVFAAGGIFTFNNLNIDPLQNNTEGDMLATDGDDVATDPGREDYVAIITDQFKIEDKTYYLLSDDFKAAYGFPQIVSQEDIGEKITTINSSVDESLIGCEVYEYRPAGSQAVVAVEKNNEYKLFKFLSFDSYNNNQDEDTAAYLELYGIKSAADIAKIQFIGHSEEAKLNGVLDIKSEITDRADITKFYDFYSVIKNSSDKYFEKLYGFRNEINNDVSVDMPTDQVAPDYAGGADEPVTNAGDQVEYAEDLVIGNALMVDKGETSPSSGSAAGALSNSVTIRIYNQSGVYFETEYYPNLGFISRHEVNSEFADFLADFIK